MELQYNHKIKIKTFSDIEKLSLELSLLLTPGNIGLSGGQTYLKLLSNWSTLKNLKLDNINFYPVDERIVDFQSLESNWGNTYRTFLFKYEHKIKNYFIDSIKYNSILDNVKMDTIFLGVGNDGHTASLFDTNSVFKNSKQNAIETISPKPPYKRISMTGEYILNSKNIIIVFYGNGKESIVKQVLAGKNLPITKLLKKVNNGTIFIHKPLIGENDE